MKRARIVRTAALVLAFFAADIYAAQSPSFEAPNDFGIDRSLKALAAKAGENWREVAEKNRTTGLEKLSWEPLTTALMEKMQKYADKATDDAALARWCDGNRLRLSGNAGILLVLEGK